jgi:hypothetical protein
MILWATAMATKGKIILSGIAFWYPLAGVAWQFLHYLLGLKRLGYDVYYVEDSARDLYDPAANDFTSDPAANIEAVAPFLEAHGFKYKWCFRSHALNRCFGLSESELGRLYDDADAFLNVTGAQEIRGEHMKIPRRIYIETDPVVSQIQVSQGDARTIAHLSAHDTHFTFGENIGQPDCLVPNERFNWLATRQPVLLDFWERNDGPSRRYTTICTWQNKGRDINYKGEIYHWSKDREFKEFIDLPRGAPVQFELATSPDEQSRRLLEQNGWRIVPSIPLSQRFDTYCAYIQNSRAEFTVAKDQNVRLRSGWFSDRSACYLAAGLPVITQETGFSNHLPTGGGLFGFFTTGNILAAIDKIESDYQRASRAARDLAIDYFDAEKVLRSLLSRAGL